MRISYWSSYVCSSDLLVGHDLTDYLMFVAMCIGRRAHHIGQTPAKTLLRMNFCMIEKVCLGNNAEQTLAAIDHWQRGHIIIVQQGPCIGQSSAELGGDQILGHDVSACRPAETTVISEDFCTLQNFLEIFSRDCQHLVIASQNGVDICV